MRKFNIRSMQAYYPMRMHRYIIKYAEYVMDNSKSMPEDDPRLTATEKHIVIQAVNHVVHGQCFGIPAFVTSYNAAIWIINMMLDSYLPYIHKLMLEAELAGDKPMSVHKKIADDFSSIRDVPSSWIDDSPMEGDII